MGLNALSMPAGQDWLCRFHLPDINVRGVMVNLRTSWQEIIGKGDYPEAVSDVLGQCVSAATLLAGDIKLHGSLSVQLRSNTGIRRIFAECSTEGKVRAIAHWDEAVDALPRVPDEFGQEAVLAVTIDHTKGTRYQGIVPLVGADFSAAFETYFAQSEQLPTALKLAVTADCSAGMLIQQLPSEGGQEVRATTEDFERIQYLFATLTPIELQTLAPEVLLPRLFAEDDIRIQPLIKLDFGCHCSRERVSNMLITLGHEEALAACHDENQVTIQCEFCNQIYQFDSIDIEQLFHAQASIQRSESGQ